MVEVSGFVENFGGVGEDEEAVGEAFGDPEEFERVVGDWPEVEAGPLAEVGGAAAEIDCDVPNVAGEDADELSLGPSELVVEPPEDSLGGEGLVVLNELGRQVVVGKGLLVENFCKPTATISKALGFNSLTSDKEVSIRSIELV